MSGSALSPPSSRPPSPAGIGRLALKLRGAYFVLLTISFAGVVSLVSVNWMELTNGPLGLPGVPPVEIALPGLPVLSLRSKSAYYYLVLAAVIACYLVCFALIRSRVGRALIALRENETLAESVGIDGTHYLVLAAVFERRHGRPGGGLYAHYTRFVSPEVFPVQLHGDDGDHGGRRWQGARWPARGGRRDLSRSCRALRALTSWQWQMPLYGVLLIAVLFFMPRYRADARRPGRRV
jgi:ABC-type branched-subunit amino acid transport system permease subunit